MAITPTATATVTKGVLVRLEAKPSKEDEVERFLTDARPLVEQESETTAWFAVRFGRSEYGIFDVFPDEQGRDAHFQGAVAAGLSQRGDELFAEAPRIERVDVLADKLPSRPPATEIQKGLLLTFAPKSEHEDVEGSRHRPRRPPTGRTPRRQPSRRARCSGERSWIATPSSLEPTDALAATEE